MNKAQSLKKAAINLAIPDFSRIEAAQLLGIASRLLPINRLRPSPFPAHGLRRDLDRSNAYRYGISRPFILYTGGSDTRKNPRSIDPCLSAITVSEYQCTQLFLPAECRWTFARGESSTSR